MSRKPRNLQAGYSYHVTTRCNNSEFELSKRECREMFLYAIKKALDKYQFKLSPYCPEVNPIERVWLYLKNLLAWGNFNSLDNLRSKLYHFLNSLSNDTIGYLTGWSWILEALCLPGI
jgi:transposase